MRLVGRKFSLLERLNGEGLSFGERLSAELKPVCELIELLCEGCRQFKRGLLTVSLQVHILWVVPTLSFPPQYGILFNKFFVFSVFFCSAFNNFLGKLNIPYLALPFNIISRLSLSYS